MCSIAPLGAPGPGARSRSPRRRRRLATCAFSPGRFLQTAWSPATDRPKLRIEQRPRGDRQASYIATIEGVDVFGAESPAGEAWLFSAESLRAVRYAETDPADRYAELTLELGDEMKGTVRVRQALYWSDSPIVELKALDPGERIDG